MSTRPENGAHRVDTSPVSAPAAGDRGQAPAHADQCTEVLAARTDPQPEPRDVRSRQQDRFGGIKWGSAFFGWLAAIGTALLLSALLTAVGTAVGLSALDVGRAGQAAQDPATARTAGIVGAVVAAVVLLVAYYCGGYVAGRMARFDGLKQGIAVWVWTVVISVVVAVLVSAGVAQVGVLGSVGGLPQVPVDGGTIGVAAVVAAVVALAVSLVGAVLGGLAGMRFHRRIDRADLDR
jgi:hypothetical protein